MNYSKRLRSSFGGWVLSPAIGRPLSYLPRRHFSPKSWSSLRIRKKAPMLRKASRSIAAFGVTWMTSASSSPIRRSYRLPGRLPNHPPLRQLLLVRLVRATLLRQSRPLEHPVDPVILSKNPLPYVKGYPLKSGMNQQFGQSMPARSIRRIGHPVLFYLGTL